MPTTLSPVQTYLIWRDRISGSGVQKLPRPTPSGYSWLYIDRERKVAALYRTRVQARDGKA